MKYRQFQDYTVTVTANFADPCIPDTMKEFTVTRKFRGGEFEIHVDNTAGICKGVKSVTVDGKAIDGNLIPPMPGKHTVEVIMA